MWQVPLVLSRWRKMFKYKFYSWVCHLNAIKSVKLK